MESLTVVRINTPDSPMFHGKKGLYICTMPDGDYKIRFEKRAEFYFSPSEVEHVETVRA
jgi:hypothetical protein